MYTFDSGFEPSVLFLFSNGSFILGSSILVMGIFYLFHARSKILLSPVIVPFGGNFNDLAVTADAYRFIKARINEGMTNKEILEAAYNLYQRVIRIDDIPKVKNISSLKDVSYSL